ncbi:MAG: ribbon-helix-helix domain-containing protein [Promethearchaeota archaeon]
MKIITINLSEPHIAALKTLQDLGLYPSRSEAIRVAIRDFLQKELGFANKIEEMEQENKEKLGGKASGITLQEKKKEISRILRKLSQEQRELGLASN